jgi:hypothetical protein
LSVCRSECGEFQTLIVFPGEVWEVGLCLLFAETVKETL